MTTVDKYGGSDRWKFDATGFFRTERTPDRWWFVDPIGNAFVTIGVAHADDSDLKYPHNLEIWKSKYGASRDRWIREGVVSDLKNWGFNTIGWTQDYVAGGWREKFSWDQIVTVQQSTSQWDLRDFRVADMPYVVLLRAMQNECWNGIGGAISDRRSGSHGPGPGTTSGWRP